VLVVQRVFRAKRTNLHEKYDYPVNGARIEFNRESRGYFVSGPASPRR
jgi:hypothetical protein